MDYFSKFLRTTNTTQNHSPVDHLQEFQKSWDTIKSTLQYPDERQLSKGIKYTSVPTHLQSLVDALVWETTRTEEGGTGVCLEYLLKNDVLGSLVRLSESDRPSGIQAEVLRTVQNMVVLMDEQFLVHSAVHRAVLRLLRNCAGDDLQEQLDGHKVLGAARSSVQSRSSVYEEDLVNLLCILCSRIRTYRELLMIFFHDKHWYQSEPLFSVEELDEDDEDEEEEEVTVTQAQDVSRHARVASPTPSQVTIKSAPAASKNKKIEYEFLLFNYLLRFVHREGQIGDFARAGLLFLMDVAMSPGETRPKPADSPPENLPHDPVQDAALALAEYILDGDFSEVLGAGLGAVYSLLPTKLVFHPIAVSTAPSGNGMSISGTVSDTVEEGEKEDSAKEKWRAMGVEDALNLDFRVRLDHFLKLLEFLQDVLRRNDTSESVDASALVGSAISQSIVDAVRLIFLENVLYPSILECSDTDGSAIAVMSYIEIMIRTLRPGRLADALVKFLLTEDNDEVRYSRQRPSSMLTLDVHGIQKKPSDKLNKLRRRKSSAMTLLEMEAPTSRKQSDYFTSMGRYTLRDLLLSNLKSMSQATTTAALQLLQSMLLNHPHLAVDRLLIVTPDPTATSFPHPFMVTPFTDTGSTSVSFDGGAETDIFRYPGAEDDTRQNNLPQFLQPETTYSTHEREMGLYLTLVSRVDPSHNSDNFSTGYEHYLSDALVSIQCQSSYQLTEDDFNDREARRKAKHRLNVNDPILSLILEAMRRFFSNTPEFNIALTGVLATLAIDPDRSLAGWLTFASNDLHNQRDLSAETTTLQNDDGDDRSIDYEIEVRLALDTNFLPATSMDETSRPVIHTIFHGLVTQLERYRAAVENFDKFLLERRQGLLFSENMTDALNVPLNMVDEPGVVATDFPTPSKPKSRPSTTSSLVSFLTPRKNKHAPLPISTTPSRPENTKNMSSPFGRHYQATGSIVVEPFIAPIPTSSPWKPAKPTKWDGEEEGVFTSSGWNSSSQTSEVNEPQAPPTKPDSVTLSQLLDNVVILEESIKELVAIIQARRSLGIDSVRYL